MPIKTGRRKQPQTSGVGAPGEPHDGLPPAPTQQMVPHQDGTTPPMLHQGMSPHHTPPMGGLPPHAGGPPPSAGVPHGAYYGPGGPGPGPVGPGPGMPMHGPHGPMNPNFF
ncbi:hypothetical protein FHG87_000924, partial [Trinorchestia longiramus]